MMPRRRLDDAKAASFVAAAVERAGWDRIEDGVQAPPLTTDKAAEISAANNFGILRWLQKG
jgi:hypothetical protein